MSDLGSVLTAPAVAVIPPGPVRLRVAAPPSKSATNRLLVVAALAEGTSRLRGPLDSDDAVAMRSVVEALGASVVDEQGDWVVTGTAGTLRTPAQPVDCNLSGTAMRFGTAVAALAEGPVTVTGAEGLLRRPIGPLTQALRALGASASDDGGLPPAVVGGGLRGGGVDVDVSTSSQYASALLLCAPYADGEVHLRLVGPTARAYIDLTVDVIRRWGATATVVEDGWIIRPGGYTARDDTVEYDASSAAHVLALAVATGGEVSVQNTSPTRQPDAMIVDVLRMMGASVSGTDGTTVIGPRTPAPVDVNLEAMPDQVTTVAALAALAPGTSRIRGVAVTRGHETDRLAALTAELGKLSVDVTERPDGLVITGGGATGPARLSTYDDHRLAMAFAAIAARVPDVVIEHPGCVTKTYPGFWDDLASGGIDVRPSP